MDIVKKFLETSIKLENHYYNFWKKIFHNDSYIFLQNAIKFYKNIQNHNFHDGYSSIINMRLYTGKCIVGTNNTLKSFGNKNNISSNELCNLTIQVINILDYVFDICPKLPFETIVFRGLSLPIDDLLLKLKEGDYYRELGINSTTVNPFYILGLFDITNTKNLKKRVFLTIILPKNTKCYYMNIPFTIDKNIEGNSLNEFELVLPRDCIYLVKSKKELNNQYFFTLELLHQVPPKDRPIEGIDEILPTRNPKKLEVKYEKKKSKMDECKWTIRLCRELYNNQKYYLLDKKHEKYIDSKKFWIYIYQSHDKNFIKLQKNIKIITIKNYNIITKKKLINLPDNLSYGTNFYYITKNNNNQKNKFFEINKKSPLLFLIEVDNKKRKKIKIKANNICNIKINIKNIKYEKIIDDYNYGLVKAKIV